MDKMKFKMMFAAFKAGEEDNLRECPFCGRRESEIIYKKCSNGYFIFVKCGLCKAQSGTYWCDGGPTKTRAAITEAMNSWNRRA